MALRSVSETATPAEILAAVDEELRSLRDATATGIAGGRLVSVNLHVGVNTIAHGLGRPPKGWVLVDTSAATALNREGAWSSESIAINASAAAAVILWVF